jgi:hypothetical protein
MDFIVEIDDVWFGDENKQYIFESESYFVKHKVKKWQDITDNMMAEIYLSGAWGHHWLKSVKKRKTAEEFMDSLK